MAIHPIVYFDIAPKPMEKHEEDANQAMFLVCVYIEGHFVSIQTMQLFLCDYFLKKAEDVMWQTLRNHMIISLKSINHEDVNLLR